MHVGAQETTPYNGPALEKTTKEGKLPANEVTVASSINKLEPSAKNTSACSRAPLLQ